MQKIQQLQPGRIAQAFKQAPWRVETQMITGLAAVLVVVIAISGMYLAEASRAATAGRDVQALELERDDLLRQNDLLRAEIARLQSVALVEQRARALGFSPATVDDLEFLSLPSNVFEVSTPVDEDAEPLTSEIPAYNETLGDWIMRNVDNVLEGD